MSLPFRILGIEHLGLAPKDAGKATAFFRDILHLPTMEQELVHEQKTYVTKIATQPASSLQRKSSFFEILVPFGDDGPVSRFLESRGGGIHHVAIEVENIRGALSYLTANGVELIDKEPRIGAHNSEVAFIHPRSTGGLLVELVELQDI